MNAKKHYKIMFVASDNSATSGAFRSMVALAALLRDEFHHEVLVVLPKFEGTGKALLDEKGIENIIIRSYTWTRTHKRLKAFKSFCKWPLQQVVNKYAIKQIDTMIKNRSIDIVHNNTSWTYVGTSAALNAGVPVVWHIREFLEEDQNRGIVNRKSGYSLMKKATRLVAISESIYQKYLAVVGQNKIVKIYNGIDDKIFYLPNHSVLNDDRINLLMVGGISESKGQYQAIRACIALYRKGYTNIMLRLVGRGNEEYITELKSIVADAGAEEYIQFCGPTNDTVSFYREADIFLMCSRAEAFGRVTVEAMMGGCLAIGANSMGTAELIEDGETGYLYESGDIDNLAEKIEYAITHKEEARRLANAGREYMINNMTARKNAEQVDALYRRILGEGGAPRTKVSLILISPESEVGYAA